MSSTSFTHIQNTIVSASQLLSTLDGSAVKSLEFLSATKPTLPITYTAGSAILGAEAYVQAATSALLVSPAAAATASNIYIGSDSTSQAQAYIRLFDLTTTSKKVILTFQLTGTNNPADGSINIANTTNAHVSVDLYAQGATAAGTKPLFAASTTAGAQRYVEVYATSLTSGSEVVGFNVLTPVYD